MRVVEMKVDKRNIPSLYATGSRKALLLQIDLPYRAMETISAIQQLQQQMPTQVNIGTMYIHKSAMKFEMDSDAWLTTVERIGKLSGASMVFGIEGNKLNKAYSRISIEALP